MNCVCTIIKNEHPYIREWALHHLSLGFDKIFLYDNNSFKDYNIEIGDLIESHQIEIKLWNDVTKARQLNAFRDFMFSEEWGEDDWCAFIDVDEFIFLDEGRNISQFIALYKQYAGVALYWKCYNANGYIQAPKKLSTIDAYTTTCVVNDFSTKMICRIRDIRDFIMVHLFVPHFGKMYVTPTGTPLCVFNIRDLNYKNGHIKHYFTKSWEDWVRRLKRGNVTQNLRLVDTFFEYNPDLEKYKDELIKELNYDEFPSI